MEEIFKIYNSICILYKDKNTLLELLYDFFACNTIPKDTLDSLLYKSLLTKGKIDEVKVFQLIGLIHQKKRESEKIANTDKRKHFGIYYTDYDIARLITKESICGLEDCELLKLKFYEPCVGGGIFVIAYIDEVLTRVEVNATNIRRLISNIYFSDIDDEVIDLLIRLLPLYINSRYKASIKIEEKNYFKGDVLFSRQDNQVTKVDPKDIFGVKEGFDIVLTNPPYKLLKANSNKYQDEASQNKYASDIKDILNFIRKHKVYKYNQGTLNYYKIFLEEILENYTKLTGRVGAIIPITLLNDKQSESLRKRIINQYKLFNLYIIPEKNEFFPDISQAFCFFALDKTEPGQVIKINPKVINSTDFSNSVVEIKVEHIEKISSSAPIVIENKIGWKILKKLNNLPKLGSLTSVCNARGELDLTLDKEFITRNRTSLPLLRGNNVSEFSYTLGEYFTNEEFTKRNTPKVKYSKRERIVCQQISNIHLEKRLKFAKIPGDIILGNSCNFLTFEESLFGNQGLTLDYLLGVLNSLLLNWRFKITNSNNHISNYELSELPIVLPSDEQREHVEKLVNLIRIGASKETISELNMFVFQLYGLADKEINYILGKHEKTVGAQFNNEKQNLFAYAS